MKTMALIQGGVVVNVALWDGSSTWDTPGMTQVEITSQPTVGIGHTYNGSKFTAPAAPPFVADALTLIQNLENTLQTKGVINSAEAAAIKI